MERRTAGDAPVRQPRLFGAAECLAHKVAHNDGGRARRSARAASVAAPAEELAGVVLDEMPAEGNPRRGARGRFRPASVRRFAQLGSPRSPSGWAFVETLADEAARDDSAAGKTMR